jgi:RimJ/RimL family protein N-acetyltransferase
MPHQRLQEYVIVDYTKEMAILAVVTGERQETIIGVGQYWIDESLYTAEVAFAVGDAYQNRGIGTELLSYLTYLAKRQGLLGFAAEVLVGNEPMLRLFEKMDFDIEKKRDAEVYELSMKFRRK